MGKGLWKNRRGQALTGIRIIARGARAIAGDPDRQHLSATSCGTSFTRS